LKRRPAVFYTHRKVLSPTHLFTHKKLFHLERNKAVACFYGYVMQLNQASIEFMRGYFSTHERGKKTEAAYRSDLEQFRAFANVELPALDGSIIESWAAHLRQEEYAPASIRRKMVVLKVFCSYWVRKGELRESPFWRVKLSFGRVEQLPRTLTEREMRALLRRAWRDYSITSDIGNNPENTFQNPVKLKASARDYRVIRDLALIDLLFATGIRVGEASALDVRDFFVQEAAFRVQGKGGRDRLAFIVDVETVNIQRVHLEARRSIKTESPALFINASGQRLSTQGMTNVLARLRREARIKRHVTPHMLRHTVATLLLRNGLDIRVVQEFLGHASIVTTQRYTHITKEHMVRELRKRHPSLSLRANKRAGGKRIK
jgi:integrase/recombinase XerD